MKATRYTKEEKNALRAKLANQQQLIKDKSLPVIVMLEGASAAGKGSAISGTICYMDPRFFKVYNMDATSEEEWKRPFLYRYAMKMPANGQFTFLDGGYVDELSKDYMAEILTKKDLKKRLKTIADYERSLHDNGYLVIKIMLQVTKEQQKERMLNLLNHKSTAWRVTEEDLWQHENFEEFMDIYQEILRKTDTKQCPWHVIENSNPKDTEGDVISIITHAIEARIAEDERNGKNYPLIENPFSMVKTTPLSEVALSGKELTQEEYEEELKELQKKLRKLHYKLYRKKIPMIIAYEGWDAAGKGGNIKRVAAALDARGYEVFPIASPTPEEKNRHFLWRFYNRLPKNGHIAIFDRTWYGRVMVERLEGFCSENDWQRAYNEINEFERDLTQEGAILIKFWVQIDKDTQLARFTDRQNTPEKQWKITDEDWRNREKWDQYEKAIDEMIAKTSTEAAPWVILESNDKKYARIKALRTIVEAVEKEI